MNFQDLEFFRDPFKLDPTSYTHNGQWLFNKSDHPNFQRDPQNFCPCNTSPKTLMSHRPWSQVWTLQRKYFWREIQKIWNSPPKICIKFFCRKILQEFLHKNFCRKCLQEFCTHFKIFVGPWLRPSKIFSSPSPASGPPLFPSKGSKRAFPGLTSRWVIPILNWSWSPLMFFLDFSLTRLSFTGCETGWTKKYPDWNFFRKID